MAHRVCAGAVQAMNALLRNCPKAALRMTTKIIYTLVEFDHLAPPCFVNFLFQVAFGLASPSFFAQYSYTMVTSILVGSLAYWTIRAWQRCHAPWLLRLQEHGVWPSRLELSKQLCDTKCEATVVLQGDAVTSAMAHAESLMQIESWQSCVLVINAS